jgi:CheY-like chemotaxis protein
VSGSTFRVALLLPSAVAAVATGNMTDVMSHRLAGRRILIADDNTLIRQLFGEHLKSLGADCVSVGDGDAAVTRATEEIFFAAILDLSMPKLDGLAAARAIRGIPVRGKTMRLIAASAHSRSSDRAVALAAGFDAYLLKPVSLAELTSAIDGAPTVQNESSDLLRARLRACFLDEVPRQAAELERLIANQDWDTCQAKAHYLKNSATVVEDHELSAVLGRMENAAAARDVAKLKAAWTEARAMLSRWVDLNEN